MWLMPPADCTVPLSSLLSWSLPAPEYQVQIPCWKAFLFSLSSWSNSKEWPQKHLGSLTYLGPTPRPPEESAQKTSRPPLYIRLYKRLAHYWAPAPKGKPLCKEVFYFLRLLLEESSFAPLPPCNLVTFKDPSIISMNSALLCVSFFSPSPLL